MTEEYKNQLQQHNESAATQVLQCPLKPTTTAVTFLTSLRSTGLRIILDEIEEHISTSNQCHHPPLKDLVLHGSLDGTTPLLLACWYGDLNHVKHIIENWGVDFQAAGVYYHGSLNAAGFDCRRIKSATPLFVASYNGHLDIVKYLVGLGADVSSKTSSDISELAPLHGAIVQSYRNPESLAIIRFLLESGADPSALLSTGLPIWAYTSCCPGVATALIQHGLNLDQLNHLGETILHYFARKCKGHDDFEGGLAVIKLLVNSGARLMARDSDGFTPILLAAAWSSWIAFDYLLDLVEIDYKEKIDSLEVAAAGILRAYSTGRNSEPERAFKYLRKALDLRHIGQLHMTPFILKSGRTIRWTTTAELDQIIEQPAEHLPLGYLIKLRICSARSCKAVVSLRYFMSDCISFLKKQNHFIDLIDVLWATLVTIQIHQTDSQHEDGLWFMVHKVVKNLTWALLQLEKDDSFFNAGTFKDFFKVILAIDLAYPRSAEPRIDRHMERLLKLVTFLAGLPEEILNEESLEEPKSIMELLRQLVFQNRHGDKIGETLLHFACYSGNLDLVSIHLLLETGAVPNARDKNGNGPLHFLAGVAAKHNNGNGVKIESVARSLLQKGAHLHLVNKKRETPADIWIKFNKRKRGVLPELGNEAFPVPQAAVLPVVEISLPEWLREPERIPMLTCLCATVIRPFLLAYKKGEDLPATLGDFIEWH